MERAVKVRRQISVDNVVEVLLVGLCFTASFLWLRVAERAAIGRLGG
jgi:hypothetical protein